MSGSRIEKIYIDEIRSGNGIKKLSDIPGYLLTKDICLAFVMRYPTKMTEIPEGIRTEQFYLDYLDAVELAKLAFKDTIHKIIVKNKNQVRSDPFVDGFPDSFIYHDLKNLKDFDLLIGEKKLAITKIRLMQEIKEIIPGYLNDFGSSVLVITAAEGAHRFLFELEKAEAKSLSLAMKAGFAETILMFNRKNASALEWDSQSMSEIYEKRSATQARYDTLHAAIKEQIISIINEQSLSEINVMDGGCGSGLFLKTFETKMNELKEKNSLNISCHLGGFDFNPENIREANKNYHGKVHFVTGDLTKTDGFINQCIKNEWINKNAQTVLVLSGSLTRLVLQNGFQALEALQSIASSNSINYMIGGGIGEPLLNPYMVKQIGYKLAPITITSEIDNFFAYEKMLPKEIFNMKLKRLAKDNILDLSLSPHSHAEALIGMLRDRIKSDTTINLSFIQLSDALIKQIEQLVKEHPNIKLVCRHNKQSEIDKLNTITSNSMFYIVTDESYLMSRNFGRFFSLLHQPQRVEEHANQPGSSHSPSLV